MKIKENIDDKTAIELWYAGLGKFFCKWRVTPGYSSDSHLDLPKYRIFFYILSGSLMAIVSFGLLLLAWFFRMLPYLVVLSIIIAGWGIQSSLSLVITKFFKGKIANQVAIQRL